MIFDFLISFSIVIIETPHISAERYSGTKHWRGRMKHWMAVHTFVDESAKLSYHKYMAEVEELKTKDGKSFTQSDWAKESTGEFATVLQKWIGTAEFFFSHCLADSEDNIIKQLEVWGVNQFFNTMVMETHYWCSAYKPAQELALMPPIEW